MTNLEKKMANLFNAIKTNNISKVSEILLENPELLNHPECTDEDGASPLWRAMLEGHEKIVELLIKDFRVDPDEKCCWLKNTYSEDLNFLVYAVTVNNVLNTEILKVIEILVKHGADVNAKLPNGSLLEVAVAKGYLQFVEVLLKGGAKLPSESDGHHLLVSEVFRQPVNRKDLLLLLIEYGLDTSYINDIFEQNHLHIFIGDHAKADDEDAVDIAKILIDQPSNGISIHGVDRDNWSPLVYAMDKLHLPLISFLIENGADVNKIRYDKNGETPLYTAVMMNDLDLVKLLLKNGADIKTKCFDGWTLLHQAYENSNEELIKLLIRNGIDISVEDEENRTPLSVLDINNVYNINCIHLMIRELSKLSYENIPISRIDMKLLEDNPDPRGYFENCVAELEKMKNYKFYAPFSYYSLLKMKKDMKKLAYLTKNEEFLANFKIGLNSFSCYKGDLQEVLEEAVQVKIRLEAVESRLRYIFNDLLPDIVIRKLSDNLTLEDLPMD